MKKWELILEDLIGFTSIIVVGLGALTRSEYLIMCGVATLTILTYSQVSQIR